MAREKIEKKFRKLMIVMLNNSAKECITYLIEFDPEWQILDAVAYENFEVVDPKKVEFTDVKLPAKMITQIKKTIIMPTGKGD